MTTRYDRYNSWGLGQPKSAGETEAADRILNARPPLPQNTGIVPPNFSPCVSCADNRNTLPGANAYPPVIKVGATAMIISAVMSALFVGGILYLVYRLGKSSKK